MTKYKNLYLWMIIPMLVMQAGIFRNYWDDFSENGWSVHIHYWAGTIWYFYLIIQPILPHMENWQGIVPTASSVCFWLVVNEKQLSV